MRIGNNYLKWNEFIEGGHGIGDSEVERRLISEAPNTCAQVIYTVCSTFKIASIPKCIGYSIFENHIGKLY